jgi:hypothetical protein
MSNKKRCINCREYQNSRCLKHNYDLPLHIAKVTSCTDHKEKEELDPIFSFTYLKMSVEEFLNNTDIQDQVYNAKPVLNDFLEYLLVSMERKEYE